MKVKADRDEASPYAAMLAAMGQVMDLPDLTCSHEANYSDEEDLPSNAPGPQPGNKITFPDGYVGTVLRRTEGGFKVEVNDDDKTERWFPTGGLENKGK